MPMQTQMVNVGAMFGQRLNSANQLHKDKPIDSGFQRLPAGISNGVAKLQVLTVKEYPDDKNGLGTKGKPFFRAAAVVLSPIMHRGQKVAGMQTSQLISLCDLPAKGKRKASTFEENWYDFQNIFKLLTNRAAVFTEDDPTGQKIWAFYMALMADLLDPQKPPVYVTFSTRGWTPPLLPGSPPGTKPNEEMVFETWHALATEEDIANINKQHDPTALIAENNGQPSHLDEPPKGNYASDIDEVMILVEEATADPKGETREGASASKRLEELAWQRGWTKEQTGSAEDWGQVGDMALNDPVKKDSDGAITKAFSAGPPIGSKWKFQRRDPSGTKLKRADGTDFPAHNVEVTEVDEHTNTCTIKNIKTDQVMVNMQTKEPLAVRWEWLEPAQ